jgi:hypothetical protein
VLNSVGSPTRADGIPCLFHERRQVSAVAVLGKEELVAIGLGRAKRRDAALPDERSGWERAWVNSSRRQVAIGTLPHVFGACSRRQGLSGMRADRRNARL